METLTKKRERGEVISDKYSEEEIIYPEDNGEPMAENTEQFNWIVKIKENLEIMYKDDPLVFVAGDLLWYPVERNNETRRAPDAMVVFGRPKGRRGSYLTWKEEGINPHVVFEILSPGNTHGELADKFNFYEKYGVEEYYLYDPDKIILKGWIRRGISLVPIENMDGWVSPKLKITFNMSGEELEIFRPNGQRFLSPLELSELSELYRQRTEAAEQRTEAAEQRTEAAEQRAESAELRAESAEQRAESAELRAEKLAALLKEMGIESNNI